MGRWIDRLRRPTADNTANSWISQVVGNKDDAAVASGSGDGTLVAYAKALLGIGQPQQLLAATYFVDGNVSVTGDGSMGSPFSTLAEAIAASNTSIGLTANRWWARRNRILVCGDQEIEEDLTVFPEKCDVVGCGFDLEAMPRIIGHHIIGAQPAGKAYGTRFYNCGFMNENAGEHIHLLSDHMCVEFHESIFWPLVTGSTHCIRLASSNRGFKLINSRILTVAGGGANAIYAEAIKVEGTSQMDMIIKDSFIHATEGIHKVADTGGYNCEITHNIIRATALTINDVASLDVVTDNRLITAADDGVAGVGGIVCNTLLANGNKITFGTGGINVDYPVVVAIA